MTLEQRIQKNLRYRASMSGVTFAMPISEKVERLEAFDETTEGQKTQLRIACLELSIAVRDALARSRHFQALTRRGSKT